MFKNRKLRIAIIVAVVVLVVVLWPPCGPQGQVSSLWATPRPENDWIAPFRLAVELSAAQPVAQRIGVSVDACLPGSGVGVGPRVGGALFRGGCGPSHCTLGRLPCGTYPGAGARA